MKYFIAILSFVAYATSAGITNYGSGVSEGSVRFDNGIGFNSGLNTQSLTLGQPNYSSGSVGITNAPIGLSGNSYGSGFGSSQGQSYRQVSSSQPILSSGNYGISQTQGPVSYGQPVITARSSPPRPVSIIQTVPNKVVQNIRPVSYTQPIVTSQPIQTVQLSPQPVITTQSIRTKQVASPSVFEKTPINLSGITQGQTVQQVNVPQQNLAPVYSGINKVQNTRPVSYTQPIVTSQPVQSVQISPRPVITTQAIRSKQVPRPSVVQKTPINRSGISQGQTVQQVTVPQQNLAPVYSGINKVQNTSPVSYSQPIIKSQPVRTVYSGANKVQNTRPVSYSQPIVTSQPIQTVQLSPQTVRTIQVARPSVVDNTPINLRQTVQKVTIPQQNVAPAYTGISKVQNTRPVSYSQPIVTSQPIRTVQVSPQPIITTQPIRTTQVVRPSSAVVQLPINLGGSSLTSKLDQGQNVLSISQPQPLNQVPVSISQTKVIAQPIRPIQIESQPIISNSKTSSGRINYGSNYEINQVQAIPQVSDIQSSPTAGNYGQIASTYGFGLGK